MRSIVRGWLAAAMAATVLVASASLTGAPAAAQVSPPEPVVFVHGFGSSPTSWNTMRDRFMASGFPADRLFAFGYDYRQSNRTSAAQLSAFVDQVRTQTGSPVVDLVAHSQGALVARWCMKSSGCDGKVDDWVSLGGNNHGSILSLCLWHKSCREMFYRSSFVRTLDSDDETPGTATYTTFWSASDLVILPHSSARLGDGATTIRVDVSHDALNEAAAVFDLLWPVVVE